MHVKCSFICMHRFVSFKESPKSIICAQHFRRGKYALLEKLIWLNPSNLLNCLLPSFTNTQTIITAVTKMLRPLEMQQVVLHWNLINLFLLSKIKTGWLCSLLEKEKNWWRISGLATLYLHWRQNTLTFGKNKNIVFFIEYQY